MKKVLLLQLESALPRPLEQIEAALQAEGFQPFPFNVPEGVPTRQANLFEDFGSLLDSEQFDLLLLLLPDNATEAELTHVRTVEDQLRRTPLVVLGPDASLADAAIGAGADDYLTYSTAGTEQLGATLRNAIARRQRWRRQQVDEQQLRYLAEANAVGWLITDLTGKVLHANLAAEELFGQTLQELCGQTLGVPAVDRKAMELDIVRLTDHGPQTAILDVRVMEILWQGKAALLQSLRDVTDYKQQIRTTRETIRQRDQFLATLSHELRNPLAAISNGTSVLTAKPGDPATVAKIGNVMRRQCATMTRLLDDLLHISRVCRGKITLDVSLKQVRDVVQSAVETVRSRILNKNQNLVQAFEQCDAQCRLDPDRLQQVVVNLLTNASKYTPEGGRISVSLSATQNQVLLEISDNGEGIPTSMLELVFEPFVQVRESCAASEEGLGIGLALARQVTELHGGTLRAVSDGVGCGAKFVVALPLAVEANDKAADSSAEPVQLNGAEAKSLSIVVVEDRDDVRGMMCQLLEIMGHQVQAASDGQQGLDIISSVRPDIALVDLGLPKISGHEVARNLRSQTDGDSLFLVALSGFGQAADKRRAKQAGFDLHVTKPLAPRDLDNLLEQAHRRRVACVES